MHLIGAYTFTLEQSSDLIGAYTQFGYAALPRSAKRESRSRKKKKEECAKRTGGGVSLLNAYAAIMPQ